MVNISSEYSLYPGTQLRELSITASTIEAVLEATGQCLTKILHVLGTITGGKVGVKEGDCCVRVVVPCKVARAIVGPRGANITQMREETEMDAVVQETMIPLGPESSVSEQVLALDGPFAALSLALAIIAHHALCYAGEAWFQQWASHSCCGVAIEGLQLLDQSGNLTLRAAMPGANGVQTMLMQQSPTWPEQVQHSPMAQHSHAQWPNVAMPGPNGMQTGQSMANMPGQYIWSA